MQLVGSGGAERGQKLKACPAVKPGQGEAFERAGEAALGRPGRVPGEGRGLGAGARRPGSVRIHGTRPARRIVTASRPDPQPHRARGTFARARARAQLRWPQTALPRRADRDRRSQTPASFAPQDRRRRRRPRRTGPEVRWPGAPAGSPPTPARRRAARRRGWTSAPEPDRPDSRRRIREPCGEP